MAQNFYHSIREKKNIQLFSSQQNKNEIRIPVKVIKRTSSKNLSKNNLTDCDDVFEIDFNSQYQQGTANLLFDYAFNPSENQIGEIIIISGLQGCGKSTILKRIEEIALMESTHNSHLTIPIMIYLIDGVVSELYYQQQIIEYLNLDDEQYQQFIIFVKNAKLDLLLLIDSKFEITPDSFFQNLNIVRTLKNQVNNCKVIFCLDYDNLQKIKKYSQYPQLNLINYEVQLFKEQQIQLFSNQYFRQTFQLKIKDIINKYYKRESLQSYEDQIVIITQNLIEMKIDYDDIHQRIILEQLKQFESQNYPLETCQFQQMFQEFKSQIKQLQDYKQFKKLFNHFQIQNLLSIPKILKLLLQILIQEQITENIGYFKFFETIMYNFLKFEKQESLQFDLAPDSVKIFNFITKFMEIKSGQLNDSNSKIFEILKSQIDNPLQNTSYLNLIILNNQGTIDYLTANFIYDKILNVNDSKSDIGRKNSISIINQNELYLYEFDISLLEYCKKIQKEGLFKKVDLSTQNYKGVVKMLKEKCWKNVQIIQRLLNIIKASSFIDDFQQEAGNAFTILCELKGIIRNENFSHIKLKNSIFNGTSFYECNFSCSEMDNVSIICCYFFGCSLDSARWNHMKNLIINIQQNSSKIVASQNEQFYASIINNNKVILYDFVTQQQKELFQESSEIDSISISPNSMLIISCCGPVLKLLQLNTQKLSRMKINCNKLSEIKFLNNEEFVVHSCNNKCVRIYNIKNQKLLRNYKTQQSTLITISQDSKKIAVAENQQLNVMSLKTFRSKFTLKGSNPMEFSQNNQLLAFTNINDQICIYNIGIKFQVMVLNLKGQEPQSISFSPDNQIIATSYYNNKQIYFWRLNTGEQLFIFELDKVSWIQFYNKKFAFGYYYSTYLLDFEAMKQCSELQNSKGEFTSLSLQGDYLAAGCKDHSIFLWDLEVGKLVNKLKAHQGKVIAVSFSSDGKLLASGSLDKSICIWEIESRNLKTRFYGHSQQINLLNFTTDGQFLASGSSDLTVRIWNVKTGKLFKIFNYPTQITTILFLNNDKILLAGGQNGCIFSTNLEMDNSIEIVKKNEPIRCIISTNDQSIIVFSSESYLVLFDLKNKRQLSQKITEIQSIALKDQFVISIYQNRIMVWQIIQNNFKLIDTIEIFQKDYNLITFYPNQNAFITACKEYQNIQLWDFKVKLWNDLELHEIDNLKQQYSNQSIFKKQNMIEDQQSEQSNSYEKIEKKPVAFSYQQDILASGNLDGSIFLWFVKTGQLLLKLVEHQSKITCLHFSPTQSILISSADTTIIVWDTEKGSIINSLKAHKSLITAFVFSPNGELMASGSQDGIIILWQVDKLSKLCELIIHNKAISCLDFSPNNKTLVSLDDEKLIIFWNLTKNQSIYKIKKQKCNWIAFWTNNKVLLSTSIGTFAYNIKTRQNINRTVWKSAEGKFCQKNQILALQYDEQIDIYDLKISQKINTHFIYFPKQFALSSDGKILSYQEQNEIKISATESEKHLEYSLYEPGLNYGSDGISGFIEFFATKDKFNTLTLKDTKQQEVLFEIRNYEGFPISADKFQNILVLANWDKTVLFWDTIKNIQINKIENFQSQVNQIKFSPNGKLIACTTFDLKLMLIESHTQNILQQLELPKISTSPIYFSDDSKKIFFQTDKFICIWRDDQSQLQIIEALQHKIQRFYLSKDEQYLSCEYYFLDQILNFSLKNSKCCFIRNRKSRVFSVQPYDNTFNVNLLSRVDAKIYNTYGVDLIERMCMI